MLVYVVTMRHWYSIILSILFIVFDQGHAEFNKNIAGPFDIVIKHVEPCDDMGTGEIEHFVKLRKISRKVTALDAILATRIPLDDRVSIMINVGQFTSNGIKKNFFQREFDRLCSAFGTFLPKMKKHFFKKIGLKDCPVPPGNYSIPNMKFTESLQQLPIFFYNKYRSEVSFKRNKKVVGCSVMFIEIVPKRSH